MAPTILFVPGFWEGPSVFAPIVALATADGFTAETAVLASTGSTSPGNPGMKDDIAAVREKIQHLVTRGDEVLLVLHSGGGFIGSEAMEALSKKERASHGERGGVIGIVFLSAAVFPEGYQHQPLPFAVVERSKGGASYCAQPEILLFNDIPDEERSKWLTALKPQPSQGWDDVVAYTGWKHVPSVYLICEEDKALPVPLQEQLAALANSKIERCNAGHLPHLSQPKRVLEVIKTAILSM
ncbi:uncharacterized protein N7459_000804 [Penicillium hispanicum]|uniref:uncharacterized protein n=1 Tax=Penicillium hispanicum TaxID=1080232 RepID=UPI00253F7BB7|nr:uncharacterized protein N7459_000804 [Penicillium hispanicum]KAJ5594596.1 hypothetical protein N7459_000804 [Penicillium hispanicum]